MQPIGGLSEAQLTRGLAAAKAVADGVVAKREPRLMPAVARAVRVEVDVDALEPAMPEKVADPFISGFMKSDPFGSPLMITLHMHLGIEIFQGDARAELDFDPARAVTALERGMLADTDLDEPTFDWWPHFATPVEALRERWNILPNDRVIEARPA